MNDDNEQISVGKEEEIEDIRQEADVGQENDGRIKWEVKKPNELYLGKSDSDWVTDWFNWFISADADRRISGPVVFLRSWGLPEKLNSAISQEMPSQSFEASSSLDPMDNEFMRYSMVNANIPNIRVGSERLRITQDQRVLVPIINSYWVKYDPSANEDWGTMLEYTGLAIDHGKSPPTPEQLTVNEKKVVSTDLSEFRIITPIFTAVIPKTEPGRSLKDFLGHPMPSGNYPAMVQGYFVMLHFEPGVYWVHAWGIAPPDNRGPYFSELLYQIEVTKKESPRISSGVRPAASENIFQQILTMKKSSGDLTPSEILHFEKYLWETKKNKVGTEVKRKSFGH
jgi:hypothetical protein